MKIPVLLIWAILLICLTIADAQHSSSIAAAANDLRSLGNEEEILAKYARAHENSSRASKATTDHKEDIKSERHSEATSSTATASKETKEDSPKKSTKDKNSNDGNEKNRMDNLEKQLSSLVDILLPKPQSNKAYSLDDLDEMKQTRLPYQQRSNYAPMRDELPVYFSMKKGLPSSELYDGYLPASSQKYHLFSQDLPQARPMRFLPEYSELAGPAPNELLEQSRSRMNPHQPTFDEEELEVKRSPNRQVDWRDFQPRTSYFNRQPEMSEDSSRRSRPNNKKTERDNLIKYTELGLAING